MGRWIRPELRLAIYRRDGFLCVFCLDPLHPSTATLDHLDGRDIEDANDPYNLLTACRRCNCSRKDSPWKEWIAREFPEKAEAIERRVYLQRRKRIDKHRKEVDQARAVREHVTRARCPWCVDLCTPCLTGYIEGALLQVPVDIEAPLTYGIAPSSSDGAPFPEPETPWEAW